MYKYLDSFTAKSKTKENEKAYYFVLIYDDISHTTFKVFVDSDVFVGIRKTYKTNDDISKILSFVKNYNNDDFHCVINKIF
jgi:hypothetical protein